MKAANNIWFGTNNSLQKIMYINVMIFVVIRITFAITSLFNAPVFSFEFVTHWLAIPSNLGSLLVRPWTLLTYMFLHWDFMHILFNMLWLYWMGNIIVEYLGEKKLWGIYLMGGIFGAFAYVIAFNIFPVFSERVDQSFALGASASVLAITVAAATLLPNYRIQLLFLGSVPLKAIAAVSVLLDVISVSGDNAGGHIAHLGGALFGFIFIRLLKNGTNLNGWLENISFPSFRRGNMKVAHRRNTSDDFFNASIKANQEHMDEVLDKINKSGYGSLTQTEKDFLFRMSKEDKK